MKLHILLIDNYDSFVFNAMHLFQTAGAAIAADASYQIESVTVTVKRNDEDFLPLLKANTFDGVIIGPGPGTPEDDAYFGHSRQVILEYGCKGLPVFGICLGFQGIYHVFGGHLKKARTPIHGKVSLMDIAPEQAGLTNVLLQNISPGAGVMRYHSIMADLAKPIPDCFHLTAFVQAKGEEQGGQQAFAYKCDINGQELMALEHKHHPIYGVQFHPESFATECGHQIAHNFLMKCAEVKSHI